MSSNSPTRKRTEAILALLANGLTHEAVAKQLNISTKTVQRHAAQVKPAIELVNDLNARASHYIEQVMPIEDRIDEYIEMLNVAKVTKQPSAGGAILTRLDEMSGFVSEKDRIRSKQAGDQQPAAMFIFPVGTSIDFGGVTINQAATTTNSASPISKDAETPKLNRISEGSDT